MKNVDVKCLIQKVKDAPKRYNWTVKNKQRVLTDEVIGEYDTLVKFKPVTSSQADEIEHLCQGAVKDLVLSFEFDNTKQEVTIQCQANFMRRVVGLTM